MIHSLPLQKNPDLIVFVPLLFTVWSDAVLTPTEINALHSLIMKQGWLTEEERQFLITQLNPSNPPSAEDLKSWLQEIRKVDVSQAQNLAAVGNALATNNGRVARKHKQH